MDVPANLLPVARNLVARKPGRVINWGWRWAATTAAIACFALLFVLVALQLRRQQLVSSPSGPLVAQTSPERVPSPRITVTAPALPAEPSPRVQTPKARSPEAPVVRGKTAGDLLPELISPGDGAVVLREALEFRWQPVPDAVFYEVRVMSAAGDLVFEEQTENTRLKPGAAAPLVTGTKYFVIARAHLRQGKVAKSSVVSFQLAQP